MLQRKIEFAIKLLQNIPSDGPIELCYSGGKDSDVILELAKMSGISFEAIYKNTTIDPPGTIRHCLDNGVRVVDPKLSFLDLVRKKGLPSRFSRFCCQVLKEYKIYDRAIQGIRKSESFARFMRYKEPEICRIYSKNDRVRVYLPILDWTDEDVFDFVEMRKIKLAPVYYDSTGLFHVERRLGCIGCPLKHDNGLSDYLRYPKLLKSVIDAQQSFFDCHSNSDAYNFYDGDAYNFIFYRLFCKNFGDYQRFLTGGLFSDFVINPRDFIIEYFGL